MTVRVTVETFIRAESDQMFASWQSRNSGLTEKAAAMPCVSG